jgi:hypothetical protein
MWEVEGTWEEIVARSAELAGRRVRVTMLEVAEDIHDAELTPAERFAAALDAIEATDDDMPFTPGGDTQALIREARSGAMWGYEPEE